MSKPGKRNIDVEKLLLKVQKHKSLYDPEDASYRDVERSKHLECHR